MFKGDITKLNTTNKYQSHFTTATSWKRFINTPSKLTDLRYFLIFSATFSLLNGKMDLLRDFRKDTDNAFLIAFTISIVFSLQSITEEALSRPRCRSPMLTVGFLRNGISRSPLDELPMMISTAFSALR